MSIHQLAHHLQSAGRGEDKVLVHMTPKEVNGLQALAMAHGGSLTINPKTGLPEAGFLSSILPMVAGFFLGPAGLGIASSALGAGAMVGAATGIATGSLSKGLMAGLGAYGGFGLAEGLAGAGAAANATKAGVSTIDDVAAAKAAQLQGTGGIPNKLSDALGATTNTGASGVSQVANINQPLAAKPFAPGFQNAGDVMRGGLATPPQVPAATDVVLKAPIENVVQSGTDAATKLQQLGGTGGVPNKLSDALGATTKASPPVTNWENVKAGFNDVTSSGTKAWEFVKKNPAPFIGAGLGLLSDLSNSGKSSSGVKKQPGTIRPYSYSVEQNQSAYAPTDSTAERTYFTEPRFVAGTPYAAKEGGIMGYAVGGPVEQMSAQNSIGDNTMYPQSQLQTPMYSNPMVQRPMSNNVIQAGGDAPVDRYSGEMRMAAGGISHLGDYSDGGRLLKGPGDGVSDSIPASIGDRQPARLADGEFVVPARIVSEIGNGSTEAGARKLYAMMDRVQKARKKTVGKNQVAKNTKADNLLPA
jgi:hypothetical protein